MRKFLCSLPSAECSISLERATIWCMEWEGFFAVDALDLGFFHGLEEDSEHGFVEEKVQVVGEAVFLEAEG